MDLEVFSYSLRSFHRSQWEISLPFIYFSHAGKRGQPTLSYVWIPKKVPLSGRAFRRTFSLDPTDCPWVSEDAPYRPLLVFKNSISNLAFSLILRRSFSRVDEFSLTWISVRSWKNLGLWVPKWLLSFHLYPSQLSFQIWIWIPHWFLSVLIKIYNVRACWFKFRK